MCDTWTSRKISYHSIIMSISANASVVRQAYTYDFESRNCCVNPGSVEERYFCNCKDAVDKCHRR